MIRPGRAAATTSLLGTVWFRSIGNGLVDAPLSVSQRRIPDMTWSAPVLTEISIGLEINGYLSAEL
jgi:hypothetical protein